MATTDTLVILFDEANPKNIGWAWRYAAADGGRSDSGPIDSLDDLLLVLRAYGAAHEVHVHHDDLDYPGDLSHLGEMFSDYPDPGVRNGWAWDETRVVVGTCADDYAIIPIPRYARVQS